MTTMRGWFFIASLLGGGVFGQNVAILDATVYASPAAAPVRHATVLVQGGRIAAVGARVAVPPGTEQLECAGCVVLSGFWNAHIHLTEPKWSRAAVIPAARLAQQIEEMLTRSGFTSVVDTGSFLLDTAALRRRIESGEVPGPRIYTAGLPLYPPNGVPYYLDDLPAAVRAGFPQPATPAAAVATIERSTADIVKLFTGSYAARDRIVHMSPEIARAAVEEGHRRGRLVYTHPSDAEGIRIAVESGVDVLAHAPSRMEKVDDALLKEAVAHRTVMIPTLKLFAGVAPIAPIRESVRRFHEMGGVLLFGTDTGYLTDYDVAEEYRQLGLAGLSFRDVLAMLTTAPASTFKTAHDGTIRIGNDGDLTVLAADPAEKLEDFTRVRYTIRAGNVIFRQRTASVTPVLD